MALLGLRYQPSLCKQVISHSAFHPSAPATSTTLRAIARDRSNAAPLPPIPESSNDYEAAISVPRVYRSFANTTVYNPDTVLPSFPNTPSVQQASSTNGNHKESPAGMVHSSQERVQSTLQRTPPGCSIVSIPSLQVHATQQLPYALYLPDIDGVGLTSAKTQSALAEHFEFHALKLQPHNSSSFAELSSYLKAYLESSLQPLHVERPVYLMGEGFGAVLAIQLALDCRHLVNRLLLVNPCTSYFNSLVSRVGPLLAHLPPQLYQAMPLALAPALGINPHKLAQEIFIAEAPEEVPMNVLKALTGTIEQLQQIAKNLPPATLQQRLALVAEGVRSVEPRLHEVEQRTMLLVGGDDMILPSKKEANSLCKKLQRAFVKVIPKGGHALLHEGNVDPVALMQEEGFYISRRTFTSAVKKGTSIAFGSAGPTELPTQQELERVSRKWTLPLRRLVSPIFLSTLEDGTIVRGLAGVPSDQRPLLVTGNHQLYALDMNVMVEEVLKERGVLLRGLAHPGLFPGHATGASSSGGSSSSSASGGDTINESSISHVGSGSNGSGSSSGSSGSGAGAGTDHTQEASVTGQQQPQPQPHHSRQHFGQNPMPHAMANLYRTYGAVIVSGQSFFRLLQKKEAVLLYPGGVREGFKRKDEQYKLFWPSKPEFVRMAAKFGTTVVPVASIGLEDSLQILLDTDEIREHPWLKERALDFDAAVPKARMGQDVEHDESFIPPIIAPNVPSRSYTLFLKPIKLTPDLCHDKERCAAVYEEIQQQLQEGIQYLLAKRKEDPYRDFLKRLAYENPPVGPHRQAPSFNL